MSLSGLLATNLLFTVFVVALPEVSKSLHASFGATTWVVTGPLLAYGVVAPLVGKAGDLFGHRRLFMAGIMAETVAAALSALAPNIGVLIAARILGGMVGASIGAASMALVLSVFDHGRPGEGARLLVARGRRRPRDRRRPRWPGHPALRVAVDVLPPGPALVDRGGARHGGAPRPGPPGVDRSDGRSSISTGPGRRRSRPASPPSSWR